MKYLKAILVLIIFGAAFVACEKNEVSYAFQEISAPTDVSAVFDIAQDDSGTVMITPSGEGAQAFNVYFGDVQNESPEVVTPGGSLEHVYEEGEYKIRIVALGSTGLTSEYNQGITISFSKPENLEVTIDQSDPNPKLVKVSASADNAASFDVYFGDADDEEPTQLMPNTVLEYTYEETGDYTIRVVAMGASAETVEYNEEITIGEASGTIVLPITFDDPAVNYTGFIDGAFEVVATSVPKGGDVNEETKVGAIENAGDAFEAIVINLGTPVDFSENKTITMKLWSESSIPIAMKFEGGVDGERENEVVVTHGGTGWEDLTFDYATDATKSYIDGNQGVGEPFVPTGKYATMVIFVDFAGTTAGTFFIDDIEQPASDLDCVEEMDENVDPGQGDINWTFKSNETNPDNPAYFEPFGNIQSEIVANPNPAGINESCNVQSYVKTAGCETWSGVGKGFDNAIDLTTADNKVFKMMVYGESKTTKVSLQLEFEPFPNTDPLVAIDQEMTKVGEWEELTFDFSEHSDKTFKSMIVYFDRDNTCDDAVYYFDNIVQVSGDDNGGSDEPKMAAPAPGQSQDDVKSLFSDTYNDETVDTWRTDWSSATLEDVTIDGSAMKKYSALDFVGIETVSSQIDASEMTHFRTDVWSADFTVLKVKLVDFGADGAFGGGDDSEHEITIESPAQGEWVSLDIPLTDFTGLTSRANIAQLIYVGAPSGNNTVFIDNIYFYKENGGGTPTTQPKTAAPAPGQSQDDVKSLFSDTYMDETVDTWRTDWSSATLEDVTIDGSAMKKYSALDFVGIETVSSQIDASGMTHFRTDVWSADFTILKVKLVDFGADGAFGGGDDTEHEITIESPAQGEWVSLDIPLTDFTGLTSRANIAQLIYVGAPSGNNTVFIDNIYFYNDNSGGGPIGGTGPTSLPIDFETSETGAGSKWDVFEADTPALEIVANPDMSTENNSSTVAKFTAPFGGADYAGTVTALSQKFTLDASNSTVSIMVWKSVISDVGIKFESNKASSGEIKIQNTKINEWEEIVFDFSGKIGEPSSTDIDAIVVFPDFDARTQDNVVYFDNITLSASSGGPSGSLALPLTFDDAGVDYEESIDGSFSVVDNPAPGGANNVASKVGAVINAGVNWEAIVANMGTPVDFGTDKTIKIKVWSTTALPILLKFEGGVSGERQNEVSVDHGGTGWEELTFDFATNATKSYIDGNSGVGESFVPTGQYATMVIFVDGPGTAAGTFYVDDIIQE